MRKQQRSITMGKNTLNNSTTNVQAKINAVTKEWAETEHKPWKELKADSQEIAEIIEKKDSDFSPQLKQVISLICKIPMERLSPRKLPVLPTFLAVVPIRKDGDKDKSPVNENSMTYGQVYINSDQVTEGKPIVRDYLRNHYFCPRSRTKIRPATPEEVADFYENRDLSQAL